MRGRTLRIGADSGWADISNEGGCYGEEKDDPRVCGSVCDGGDAAH
jgi:hypothetical protein